VLLTVYALTRVRSYLLPYHDYVLWLDADVVKYPPTLIRQLYDTNSMGVTAPLVVIEGSDEAWCVPDASPAPQCYLPSQLASQIDDSACMADHWL
jgi:hypothetical protein